jgi:ribonuclease HII
VTVAEIKETFSKATVDRLPSLISQHASDSRAGVRSAVESAQRRLEKHEREEARLDSLAEHQMALHADGFLVVAGVDEVGRGALAGPVSAAAVVLPAETRIPGLDDSKRLDPQMRVELSIRIRDAATSAAVSHVEAATIDAIGIAPATRQAMVDALASLSPLPDHAIVDGLPVDLGRPTTAVVDGDRKVAAIAAASIIAKVERDALMCALDDRYPGYGFASNKGYGTDDHRMALGRRGPCEIHRRSFTPCGGTSPLF